VIFRRKKKSEEMREKSIQRERVAMRMRGYAALRVRRWKLSKRIKIDKTQD